MNPFIPKLLANIPGGYSPDAQLVPSLTISGTGYLAIVGTTLYLTTGTTSTQYDLYNLTVSQLAGQIGTSASVSLDGIVELLTLADGQTSATLPATLYLPSNQLYYLLGMQARILEGRLRSLNGQSAQLNLQAAVSRLLDWWGASLGLGRYQGEPDILYAQRLVGMRFRPTQNAYSIMRLFKDLGYAAQVTTTGPGAFSVQITVPKSPPSGFVYTLAQMGDILKQVKSAGYQGTVTVQASLADSVALTDSVTATLNSAAWTVGNVIIGQFTV